MKICFYFGGFAVVGGIETGARNLLQYLHHNGYDVSLVCWGEDSLLLRELRNNGVKVKRLGWRWGCRLRVPDWLMLPLGLWMSKNADVILFGKLLPENVLKAIRYRNPSARMVFITPYKPEVPKNKVVRSKVSKLFDVFDELWVQAEEFREKFVEIGVSKPSVVLPYMSQPMPSLIQLPAGAFKVGFLGRLVEDKNLSLLLQSFRQLLDRLPTIGCPAEHGQASLHIFGDGPLRSALEREANELGISALVHFHGALLQSEVERAVALCHLFVFTSHVEGQCLAALEILACGRPIVATLSGAFPEILDDEVFGGLVYNAVPEAVSAEIAKVAARLSTGDLSVEQIQEAYNSRFGPEELGRRYKNVLLRLGKK